MLAAVETPRASRAAILTRARRQVRVQGWGLVAPGPGGADADSTTAHALSLLSARDARKLDRFSVLAIAAARQALAGMDPAAVANCGIVSGTMMAGWSFTEPQLALLHGSGLSAMSPYLATAWFPAAPQGEISIHLGLRGFAKTVTTDQCSGSAAIALGASRIATGRSTLLLTGGAEAPRTTLVQAALAARGRRVDRLSDGAAYLRLGTDGTGFLTLAAHDAVARLSPSALDTLAGRSLVRHRALGCPAVEVAVLTADDGAEVDALVRRLSRDLGIAGQGWHRTLERGGDSLGAASAVGAVTACQLAAAQGGRGAAIAVAVGDEGADVLWFMVDR